MKTIQELTKEMEAAEQAMFDADDAIRNGVKPGAVENNRKLISAADKAKEIYYAACRAVRKHK